MTRMDGKVVLITGATNGIGKVAALELAKMGATVVLVGRNQAKTQATVDEIKNGSGSSQIESLIADLSVMSEVRRLAEEFKAKYTRLDVLLNNAGAVFADRQETDDGYEMTFALNHLSYFLLTNLLLDLLKASAPARIVNVSSGAHMGGRLNFEDLNRQKGYGLGGYGAYGQSKLANVMFTYELARRLAGTGVTATVLHPGFVATGFGRNVPGLMARLMPLMHRLALTPEEGAQTMIFLASSPNVEGVTGKYFDKCKVVSSSKASYNEADQRQLWAVSEEMTGLKTAAPV
ncbi:MAG TPA: SDR family oxidoreductase [Phototrophicaceae bacterium]|nr:SDR family oxidoreductase [Phototrophicaceae bacterium]